MWSLWHLCHLRTSGWGHLKIKWHGKKKKMDDDQDKRHGQGSGRGRSNHAGDRIGNFKADTMAACIAEIHFWENKVKAEGKGRPDKHNSKNQIFKRHGLSPSTVSKRMTGKVQGLQMTHLDLPSFFLPQKSFPCRTPWHHAAWGFSLFQLPSSEKKL